MPIDCPRCQKQSETLFEVPSELQLILLDISLNDSLFTQVCGDCLRTLKLGAKNPAQLRNSKGSEENQKMALWTSRGDFIKQARKALDENHWLQAAKLYQSYISALEKVFDQRPDSLTPDVFRVMNKIEEMKTLVLVYWELVLIFDGKNERMVDEYARKIVLFGLCSPLKFTLLDKIKAYEPQSSFKKYFKRMDRELRGEKGLFGWLKSS